MPGLGAVIGLQFVGHSSGWMLMAYCSNLTTPVIVVGAMLARAQAASVSASEVRWTSRTLSIHRGSSVSTIVSSQTVIQERVFFARQFLVKRRTPANGVFESEAGGLVDLNRLEYRVGLERVGSVGDSSGRSQRGSS